MKYMRIFIVMFLLVGSISVLPSLAQEDDNLTPPTTLRNMEWQVLALLPEAYVDAIVPNGYGHAVSLTITWPEHHHEVRVFSVEANEDGELYQANRSQWQSVISDLLDTALAATITDHSGETLFLTNEETFLVRRDMTGALYFGQKVGPTAYTGTITVENGHITYPDFFQPTEITDHSGQLCAISFGAPLDPTTVAALEESCENLDLHPPVVSFAQALPYAEVRICFECFYPYFN